jgi:HPt (histidine-containing phosphotransfer) domain-containing protein
MLKNTFKMLFLLCSLGSIALIAYGMEMEQEPKKLKLAKPKNLEEKRALVEDLKKRIARFIEEGDLQSLKECLAALTPTSSKLILNSLIENDSKTNKSLPLKCAIDGFAILV